MAAATGAPTGLSARHKPAHGPVLLRGPNEAELAASESLRTHMGRVAPLEDAAGHEKRQRILNRLGAMTRAWIKRTCLAKGVPEEAAEEAGGTVLISGSYRIGVHDPDGDIDAVIVVPRSVNHDDCFDGLGEELRALPEVTELSLIRDARVPIIGLKFDGVDLDLLFVLLTRSSVPETLDILDDEILVGLDDASVASINGPRVTDLIIKLVPDLENFKLCLRAVRHWAKKRGVYSNKIGFLGGVNFNIMVAFVCQLYPNLPPAALLLRFFTLYAQWRWPQPVMLCENYETSLGLPVWNPEKNHREKFQRMPIITPAYPASNSSFNVTNSTLKIMRDEFKRGGEVMARIMEQPPDEMDWDELFTPTDFFTRYDSYLQVDATAGTAEGLEEWAGWVESRLRRLVDTIEHQQIGRAHV
uniref:Poly(A) polymerase n=1 Tax=Bicosoecida sp. CB-2014 TaxID=1486930 RepID=A0A7S1CGZ1_9STRA|mmetsp:Transcript_23861/g.82897  ORF Transcript_23861/g.82897 Transcript_23861/m.82897 type:complete len:415 (+) Transcript_23861:199-1443(+)